MKKLTVTEAAEFFGITKEAVYNRVRRGKLSTVIEKGLKYVIIDEQQKKVSPSVVKRETVRKKITDDRYTIFLEEQIKELKSKTKELESDNKRLFLEKERMLIESKKELEMIFRERDEQLKKILSLMSAQKRLKKPSEDEVIDAKIEDKKEKKKRKKKKKKKSKK